MRNIFLFIRRYFNFLFFLVLQIIALSFLFRYNKFHEAAFMGVANELTGRVSSKYSNVEYYFHLKKINESLAQQNEQLLNQLKNNYPGTRLPHAGCDRYREQRHVRYLHAVTCGAAHGW